MCRLLSKARGGIWFNCSVELRHAVAAGQANLGWLGLVLLAPPSLVGGYFSNKSRLLFEGLDKMA